MKGNGPSLNPATQRHTGLESETLFSAFSEIHLGSGNIGATNVFRTLGKGIGIPVFFLDVLKGALPVIVVQNMYPGEDLFAVLAALGSILGHTFTFWLGFKGGKGVATSGGATGFSLRMFATVVVPTCNPARANVSAIFRLPIVGQRVLSC